MKTLHWSPAVTQWLRMNVGLGKYHCERQSTKERILKFSFEKAEDATAFTLRWNK